MDMSEIPQYLVDFYLPLAENFSNLVGKFRPECDNERISERLNKFFYEMVVSNALKMTVG